MSSTFLAEVSLAADPRLIRTARLVVSSLAADQGFSVDDIEDLKLAVQEACVSRLALGVAHERVRIELWLDGTSLLIQVSGDRPGEGEEDEEASLGLSLAEALVDELRIEDAPGAQRVLLRKGLPTASGGAAD